MPENEPYRLNAGTTRTTVFGVYKGMGDLLAALPVILADIQMGHQAIVIIFSQLEPLLKILDLGGSRERLHLIVLPHRKRELFSLIREVRRRAPNFFWVSPHAPMAARGWKAPALMWILRTLAGSSRSTLAGATSERLSWLFDLSVPIDRTLPFTRREWEAYFAACGMSDLPKIQNVCFSKNFSALTSQSHLYDLAVFPSATASNRKWPLEYYDELLRLLPPSFRVVFVVTGNDGIILKSLLSDHRNVNFSVGSLEMAITAMARSRLTLCMESGPMFFAEALGTMVLALFGVSNPLSVIRQRDGLFPIYEQRWSCQPCYRTTCMFTKNRCLASLTPTRVAQEIIKASRAGNSISGIGAHLGNI